MAQKVVDVLKIMIIAYVITAVMLFILSFCLYKLGFSEWQITAGIIITYAISAFVGGYCLAKRKSNGKLLWGMLFGVIYFAVLVIASIAINRGLSIDKVSLIRAAVVSIGAGAIGAFATPVTRN